MKITCTKCGDTKPENEFHWKNKKLGKRCLFCRDCKKEIQKQYYNANKEAYLAKIMETRRIRKSKALQLAKEYLEIHPCVDCGEADIRKLEFDHVFGVKRLAVCQMIQEGYSWDAISQEIDKCEIRCGNCHMIKTWPNRWNS